MSVNKKNRTKYFDSTLIPLLSYKKNNNIFLTQSLYYDKSRSKNNVECINKKSWNNIKINIIHDDRAFKLLNKLIWLDFGATF